MYFEEAYNALKQYQRRPIAKKNLVAEAILGRFSNFFQKKYSKRDQPYSQAANPFGQYIGLSGLSLIRHFCLLFLSILLTTLYLFIINFTNEGGLIIMILIIILVSFWTAIAAALRYVYVFSIDLCQNRHRYGINVSVLNKK